MNIDQTEKHTEVMNIQCTPTEKAMARQLAQASGMNMSHVVRQSIQSAHEMTFSNQPRCATGKYCLCPTMHTVRPAQGPSPQERVLAAQQTLESDERPE